MIEKLKSLGIFLVGLGIFLIAIVGVLFYLKVESFEKYREAFYAFCQEGYIEIKSYTDLYNVKILFDNVTICSWNIVPKYTSRVCDVTEYFNKNTTLFIVRTDKGEDIVKCYKYEFK